MFALILKQFGLPVDFQNNLNLPEMAVKAALEPFESEASKEL